MHDGLLTSEFEKRYAAALRKSDASSWCAAPIMNSRDLRRGHNIAGHLTRIETDGMLLERFASTDTGNAPC